VIFCNLTEAKNCLVIFRMVARQFFTCKQNEKLLANPQAISRVKDKQKIT
jgi:hypothetical protein